MRKLSNEELNRLSIIEYKNIEKRALSVILDNVRSLNNIGSIFRTCDAFLVEKLYLCGITACPPNKDIHKTALGATESVEWEYADDTLKILTKLKGEGYTIFAAEQTDKSHMLEEIKLDKNMKYAIVFGHEVRGVDQAVIDMCDASVEIPQHGTKHSLNVSVSAGIVIWEMFKGLNE